MKVYTEKSSFLLKTTQFFIDKCLSCIGSKIIHFTNLGANMKNNEIIHLLSAGTYDSNIQRIYGADNLEFQKTRYTKLVEEFSDKFGECDCAIYSASGRTELGGNHTDHNHGKVLAAGIQLDALAVASPSEDATIELYSEGFEDKFSVDISSLDPVESEKETTHALIRGVAAGLKNSGYKVGGFKAVVTSNVLRGSGLSSSAAFEVLIGTVLNHIYNSGSISAIDIAKFSQFAENTFFGKPCGLMDQMACSYGRMTGIDFNTPDNPEIEQLDFSFKKHGFTLMVVDTGGSHADLTDDYASIPKEMKKVASFFKKETCREISYNDILNNIQQLRSFANDRAILRAIHFIKDNERVEQMIEAAKNDDIAAYFKLVKESGRSSFQYLQNIFSPHSPLEQGISLALALTESFLGDDGAFRVQGGGFAGTIQAYIPNSRESDYISLMENTFGAGCVTKISIRPEGAAKVIG